jgi:hypothetical protein
MLKFGASYRCCHPAVSHAPCQLGGCLILFGVCKYNVVILVHISRISKVSTWVSLT